MVAITQVDESALPDQRNVRCRTDRRNHHRHRHKYVVIRQLTDFNTAQGWRRQIIALACYVLARSSTVTTVRHGLSPSPFCRYGLPVIASSCFAINLAISRHAIAGRQAQQHTWLHFLSGTFSPSSVTRRGIKSVFLSAFEER